VAEHTLGSFRDPDMIRRAPGRTLHDCPHTYLRM